MRKYWKSFTLSLASTMQYRANLGLWLIVAWLQPLTSLIIWFAIIGERAGVGGYSKGDFLLYYLSMTITWYLVGGVFAGSLGSRIKSGELNKYLLKPYSLILEVAAGEQAWKVVSLVMSLPLFVGALWWGRELLTVQYGPYEIVMLVVTTVLGAILFALVEAIAGTAGFWFVETWPVSETVGVVRMLFGGVLAPLPLLPQFIQQVSSWLPFRYMFYPAVSVITGKAENTGGDVFGQVGFILLLYVVLKLLWRKGLRKYEGIGG